MEALQEQSQTTLNSQPNNISELISMIIEAGDEAMLATAAEPQEQAQM